MSLLDYIQEEKGMYKIIQQTKFCDGWQVIQGKFPLTYRTVDEAYERICLEVGRRPGYAQIDTDAIWAVHVNDCQIFTIYAP